MNLIFSRDKKCKILTRLGDTRKGKKSHHTEIDTEIKSTVSLRLLKRKQENRDYAERNFITKVLYLSFNERTQRLFISYIGPINICNMSCNFGYEGLSSSFLPTLSHFSLLHLLLLLRFSNEEESTDFHNFRREREREREASMMKKSDSRV